MSKMLLAVDQATTTSGWSLYKDGALIKHGKVTFDGIEIERISQVKNWLDQLVDILQEEQPESLEVILEDIQYQPNYEKEKVEGAVASVTTFKTLAHLQGTLLVLLYEKGIKTRVYFSTEWKKTFGIKGKGRAEQKRNAQAYVKDQMEINATQDECDAILLGKHAIEEDDKNINWG